MQTQDIKNIVSEILTTSFEVSSDRLTDETHLFNDLALDSLDAVDMLVLLEGKLGQKIDGQQFVQVRTLKDVYVLLEGLMNNSQSTALLA